MHLEEKERIERERLQQIIDDADDYKDELIAKRKMNREANIKKNRDQEKVMGILFLVLLDSDCVLRFSIIKMLLLALVVTWITWVCKVHLVWIPGLLGMIAELRWFN